MPDVTRILSEIERGDLSAAGELLPLVYDELRNLAAARLDQEQSGQTLQATALVHEAYLRLVGPMDRFENRAHFFAAAAEAMRRILIDRARNKRRLKRQGEQVPIHLDAVVAALDTPADDLLALDEALSSLQEQFPD